jgi:hypothetical protein
VSEGVSYHFQQQLTTEVDPWDCLNISEIAVDTGIEDFAKNHDHYLYGFDCNINI